MCELRVTPVAWIGGGGQSAGSEKEGRQNDYFKFKKICALKNF
jgi:hypothetical protein